MLFTQQTESASKGNPCFPQDRGDRLDISAPFRSNYGKRWKTWYPCLFIFTVIVALACFWVFKCNSGYGSHSTHFLPCVFLFNAREEGDFFPSRTLRAVLCSVEHQASDIDRSHRAAQGLHTSWLKLSCVEMCACSLLLIYCVMSHHLIF